MFACNGTGESNATSTQALSNTPTGNKDVASTYAETSPKLEEYSLVYTADHSKNLIHVFELLHNKLKQLPDVSVEGNGPSSITVSPDEKHLYVVLDTDKKIKHFKIDLTSSRSGLSLQSDGLDNLPFKPGKLIFAENSKAYISSSSDEADPHLMIVGYNTSSGKFDQSVHPIEDQKSAADIVLSVDKRHFWEGFTGVDPTGAYSIKGFYAFYSDEGIVGTPNVNASNDLGAVNALAVQTIGVYENLLAIDKTNQRLLSYRINLNESTTGIMLSGINSVPTGNGPSDVVVAPNAGFAYVANTIS